MRELLHPVLGTKRVYPDAISAKAAIEAAPPKAKDIVSPAGLITMPRVAEHSLGLILTPVSPERARAILLAALQGDLWMQYDLFSRMEDTWDRLGKDLNEVRNAVKRLNWVVTPYSEGENEPTKTAEAKADLVRRALKSWQPQVGSLEYGFEECIYHALDAMPKGISVQEIHWDLTADGFWLPQAAHYLTPRQYGWSPDGTQLGLMWGPQSTAANSGTWMPFPQDKFLVGAWHFRSGFPGATALLRSLVPYWIGITYGWQWLMQTAQIFGVPFRWATYDSTRPGLLDQVSTMLENLGAAGWGAFPAGTTLEFKEAVTNARDNPQSLIIELAKQACDLVILGQTLSGENQPTGLGSGNAMLHGQIRQDVLHGAAHWIADLFNYQLVDAILRLNYGETSESPVVAPDLSVDPDPKTLAERDQILLANTNIQMPKKYFHERHGVPIPAPGEEVITGKGPANPMDPNAEPDGDEKPEKAKNTATEAKAFLHAACCAIEAKANDAAADKLVNNVLEDLTGVEARWLGGVKPFFRKLIEAARDENLTDAEFIGVLEKAQKDMPELFAKLDRKALEDSLYNAMSAACVNGAVQGFLKRRHHRGK